MSIDHLFANLDLNLSMLLNPSCSHMLNHFFDSLSLVVKHILVCQIEIQLFHPLESCRDFTALVETLFQLLLSTWTDFSPKSR